MKQRNSPDEPQLISRVLGGDRSSFRPLVETYEPAVFGLCRKLLGGDEAEAEDLSQETFLRAFSRLDDLKDHRRFAPWLYQIARSLCRDRRRRFVAERRALEARSNFERWRVELRPDHPAVDSEEISSVLREMPDVERRALELKYFQGLSYSEISGLMGLSFSRVDHLIRQARARLSRRVSVSRREPVPVGTENLS